MSEFEHGERDGDEPTQHEIDMSADALEEYEYVVNDILRTLTTSQSIIGATMPKDMRQLIDEFLRDYYCGDELKRHREVVGS